MPSRRTLRTAIRAFSAYWPTSLASSLRRSSVRSGIGRRIIWPSVIGLSPSPAERIAFSTGWTLDRSHTWTDSMRASGTDTVATWLSGMLRAVNLDLDRIEQGGRGAAGAKAAEVVLQRFDARRACGA